MGELQQIVDKLNQAPFDLALSLVSFSQKSPQELRELLNDVLATIDNRQRRELRDETPDVTTARHLDLLRVLKYKVSTDGATFRQGMLDADPLTVYPLLLWLLNQLPLLQKRAYLAQFLVDEPIPEELFLDPEIQDTHALVKELQEQFKEVHKAVDQSRKTQRDPRSLKAQLAGLEGEKEQLGGRVERVKEKTKNVAGVDAFLEVASLLRRQQEEAGALAQSLAQQQDVLDAAGQKEARALAKLRDAHARAASGAGPAALLAALAEETSLARYGAQERLPKEIAARRERLQAVQTVLNEPVSSEQDLAAMQAELRALQTDVNALTERRDAREATGQDAVLRQQQQMAAIVARKKDATWQKLEELNARRSEVAQELGQKQAAAASGSGRVLKGEEFKRYAASLRSKNATYKRLKKELDDRTAEFGVLMRTQQILQEQAAGLREAIEDAEKQGGMARKTSQTSATLAASDDHSPEGLSRALARVNDAIKERKAALAPRVKDLRALRTSLQEAEEEHGARKKKFEEGAMVLDGQRNKFEAEVERERADLQRQEKRAKELAEEAATVETNIKRVVEDGAGFVERYKKDLAAQEELAKTLQERQRRLKDQERSAQSQKVMVSDLRTLLQVKLRLASGSATWAASGGAPAHAFKSVEVVDKGGANRLVIGASD